MSVSGWLKVTANAPPAKNSTRLCGNQKKSQCSGGKQDVLPLQGIKAWLLGHSARSVVNIPQDSKRFELMKGTSTRRLWDK
jgi:hypothetical protein